MRVDTSEANNEVSQGPMLQVSVREPSALGAAPTWAIWVSPPQFRLATGSPVTPVQKPMLHCCAKHAGSRSRKMIASLFIKTVLSPWLTNIASLYPGAQRQSYGTNR